MNTVKDIPQELVVDLKTKTAMVVDSGLFVELSKTLSVSFKKVYYFMPWASAFPKSNQYIVGHGIEGVERVDYMWDFINKVDIFIFPDVYFGDLQVFLVSIGKTVWGGRKGEEMELYRDKMKDYMKSIGLYVTPFRVIQGVKALREYLKDNDNVYVKINLLRGNFETFQSINYELSEPQLDEIEYKLGAMKTIQEFVVEKAFDNAVESGVDMYSVDGKYPSKLIVGIEIKDLGFLGRIMAYKKIPVAITDFNDKIVTALKGYGYRGFISTEVRINKKGISYMPDLCARSSSPCNELYQIMYKNLADIIWYGAKGYIIDPITEFEYGVEVLIHSQWADENWQPIAFPKKYRGNIKLRNACVIDGKYYCVPQIVGLAEIGAIVAEGHTLQEAIDKVKAIAETVKGYYIDIKLESIDQAICEFKKLEEFGVKIL